MASQEAGPSSRPMQGIVTLHGRTGEDLVEPPCAGCDVAKEIQDLIDCCCGSPPTTAFLDTTTCPDASTGGGACAFLPFPDCDSCVEAQVEHQVQHQIQHQHLHRNQHEAVRHVHIEAHGQTLCSLGASGPSPGHGHGLGLGLGLGEGGSEVHGLEVLSTVPGVPDCSDCVSAHKDHARAKDLFITAAQAHSQAHAPPPFEGPGSGPALDFQGSTLAASQVSKCSFEGCPLPDFATLFSVCQAPAPASITTCAGSSATSTSTGTSSSTATTCAAAATSAKNTLTLTDEELDDALWAHLLSAHVHNSSHTIVDGTSGSAPSSLTCASHHHATVTTGTTAACQHATVAPCGQVLPPPCTSTTALEPCDASQQHAHGIAQLGMHCGLMPMAPYLAVCPSSQSTATSAGNMTNIASTHSTTACATDHCNLDGFLGQLTTHWHCVPCTSAECLSSSATSNTNTGPSSMGSFVLRPGDLVSPCGASSAAMSAAVLAPFYYYSHVAGVLGMGQGMGLGAGGAEWCTEGSHWSAMPASMGAGGGCGSDGASEHSKSATHAHGHGHGHGGRKRTVSQIVSLPAAACGGGGGALSACNGGLGSAAASALLSCGACTGCGDLNAAPTSTAAAAGACSMSACMPASALDFCCGGVQPSDAACARRHIKRRRLTIASQGTDATSITPSASPSLESVLSAGTARLGGLGSSSLSSPSVRSGSGSLSTLPSPMHGHMAPDGDANAGTQRDKMSGGGSVETGGGETQTDADVDEAVAAAALLASGLRGGKMTAAESGVSRTGRFPAVATARKASQAGHDLTGTADSNDVDVDDDGDVVHMCKWAGCHQTFASSAELTAHLTDVHVGSRKSLYVCEWEGCERRGRVFTQRQKLCRHLQSHTGDRPFECHICHKFFTETTTLTQHIRAAHTTDRPFKCDYPGCDKAFSVAGSLTIHKRTHTGEKPFVCPFEGCGKAFGESSNLTKHLRVHTGARPFVCPECGSGFARPDGLERHRKIHRRRGGVADADTDKGDEVEGGAEPAAVTV